METEEFKQEFAQLLRDYVDVHHPCIWQNGFPINTDVKFI